ncbi:peptidoglycan-binding protein [Terasakiella pusilla]|uniref:peptidoglycan-binding protein n=1 Tax=Terasakiella pusilla TaxID=64973 RepID=UPI003AA7D481
MRTLSALVILALLSTPAGAAKPTGLDRPSAEPEVFTLDHPIKRAQELLKQLDFYKGKIDGLRTPALDNAISAYQRLYNLPQSSTISEEFLAHLENIGRVRILIGRLNMVRKQKQDSARQALLSDPRTRQLLEQKNREVADPTRDVSECFSQPSARCLLKEAVESSRAVYEDDLRDWALGEILAAQVASGLSTEAMETAGRIKDSRLIIAALTNIAKTHAKEGQIPEALSGLNLIPLAHRRLSVLLDVAETYKDAGNHEALSALISRILAGAQSVEDLEERLSLQLKAAELVASTDNQRALQLLRDATATIEKDLSDQPKLSLLRQTATTLAKAGHPNQALEAMGKLPNDDTRIPILMAAARAFLEQRKFKDAQSVIERILSARYRSIILCDLANQYWHTGERTRALQTLEEALNLSNDIKLPFAQNYAYAQITATLSAIVAESGDLVVAKQAYQTLGKISDDRLKARAFWRLNTIARQHGLQLSENDLDGETDQAMAEIKSQFSKAWILGDLAESHFNNGETEQAQKALKLGLQTVRDLKNPWARSRALAKFGVVLHRLD